MPILIHPNCWKSFFNSSLLITNPSVSTAIAPISSFSYTNYCGNLCFSVKSPKSTQTHVSFCTKNGVFEETLKPKRAENDEELEGLELLNKPSPKQVDNGAVEDEEEESKKVDKEEILEPFNKLFGPYEEESTESERSIEEVKEKVTVEYYDPKPGDFVAGVVVSGNENKLDVNVGADMLGTMLTNEVLPLYDKEMENLLCDVERDVEEFMVRGKVIRSGKAFIQVVIQFGDQTVQVVIQVVDQAVRAKTSFEPVQSMVHAVQAAHYKVQFLVQFQVVAISSARHLWQLGSTALSTSQLISTATRHSTSSSARQLRQMGSTAARHSASS